MKSKRLISLLCAAAMATSTFVGLASTASAATEADILWSDTFNNAATGVIADGTNSQQTVADYVNGLTFVTTNRGSGDKASYTDSEGNYVLSGSYYAVMDDKDDKTDKYVRMSFPHFGDFAKQGRWGHVDLGESGYAATADKDVIMDFDLRLTDGLNKGEKSEKTPILRIGSFNAEGKEATAVEIDKETYSIGDDWVHARIIVSNASGAKLYIDGDEITAAANADVKALNSIGLYSNNPEECGDGAMADLVGNSQYDDGTLNDASKPTKSAIADVDNVIIYNEAAGVATGTSQAPGAQSQTGGATPKPVETAVPIGTAPTLAISTEKFIDKDSIEVYNFNDLKPAKWSLSTADQDVENIDGLNIHIGSRDKGGSVSTFAAIVKGDNDNVLQMQAGQYAHAGRGPRLNVKTSMADAFAEGKTVAMSMAVKLSVPLEYKDNADAKPRLYFLKNADQAGEDGAGAYNKVAAVLTTDPDEEIMRGESDVISAYITPDEWHYVTFVVSPKDGGATHRLYVDGGEEPAVKCDYVATGEAATYMDDLPMLSVQSKAAKIEGSDVGPDFGLANIDNLMVYYGEPSEPKRMCATPGEAPDVTKAPATPTPEPIAKVTMALNDAKTGVTMTSDIDTKAVLVRASYSTNNTLTAIKVMKNVNLTAKTAAEETLLADGEIQLTKGDKIMLWDGTKRMAPLAAAISITEGADQATPEPVPTAAPTAAPTADPTATDTPATDTPATEAPTAAPKFAVTVATAENGTATVDKATAAEGETVTITVKPNMGYEGTVTVKDADNGDVTVTDNTFTMPAKAVTVTPVFALDPNKQVIAAAHTAHAQWGLNAAEATMDNALEHFNMDTDSGWTAAAFMEFDITNVDISTLDTATVTYTATSAKGYGSTMYYLTGDVDLSTLTADATSRFAGAKVSVNAAVPSVQNGVTLTQDITEAVKARLVAGKTSVILQLTGNNGGADLSGKASDKAPVLLIQKGEAAGKEIAVTVKDKTDAPVAGAVVTAVKKAASPVSLMALNPVYTTSAKTNEQGVATLRLADGDYTITAAKDGKTIKTADMAVNAESAAALEIKETTYAVAINGGAETVTIPAGELYTAPAAFTAAVTADTAAVDGATVAWSVKEADTKTSISEAGVLTVDKTATAGNITLVATYTTPEGNTVTGEKTVALTAPVAATIEVSGDAEAAIPAEEPEVAANYSAVAKDVHGNVLSDQTFTWSVEGENASITDGALTVQNTATAGSVTVKAAIGSVEGTKAVSLISVPTYAITVTEPAAGGTLTASSRKAAADRTVTITAVPATGYKIAENGLTVSKAEGTVATTAGENNTYTFTMPAEAVTVAVNYVKIDYAITNATAADAGGTITVNATAQMGDEVTITVAPAEGKELDTLTWKAASAEEATAITAVEGVYKFTMPAEAVTVTATFDTIKINRAASEDVDVLYTVANADKDGNRSVSNLSGTVVYDFNTIPYYSQQATFDFDFKMAVGDKMTIIMGKSSGTEGFNGTQTSDLKFFVEDGKVKFLQTYGGKDKQKDQALYDIDSTLTGDLNAGTWYRATLTTNPTGTGAGRLKFEVYAVNAETLAIGDKIYSADVDPRMATKNDLNRVKIWVESGAPKLDNAYVTTPKKYETTVNVKASGENGAAIEGAAVTVKNGDATAATGTTTAEGKYVVNLLPGSYTVDVAKDGYTASTGTALTVAKGGANSVEIALEEQSDPMYTVTVNTAPFATVKLNAGTSTKGTAVAEQTVTADAKGVATLTDVPAGSYTADVTSSNGYLVNKTNAAVTVVNAETPLNLTLDCNTETYPNLIYGEDFTYTAGSKLLAGTSTGNILLNGIMSLNNSAYPFLMASSGGANGTGGNVLQLADNNNFGYFSGAYNAAPTLTYNPNVAISKIKFDAAIGAQAWAGGTPSARGTGAVTLNLGNLAITMTPASNDIQKNTNIGSACTISITDGTTTKTATSTVNQLAWAKYEVEVGAENAVTVKITPAGGTAETIDGFVLTAAATQFNFVGASNVAGLGLDNFEIYGAATATTPDETPAEG